MIVNNEGIPIRSTLKNEETIQYAALITQLTSKARSVVRDLDPQNDLTFLRVRSKKHEIMIAPGKYHFLYLKKSRFEGSLDILHRFFGLLRPILHLTLTANLFAVPKLKIKKKLDKDYILIVIQNPQNQ